MNINNILSIHKQKNPKSVAIITEKYQITYENLENYISKMTTFLYCKGVKEDAVVITLFNSELLEAIFMFAIPRMGATIFPIPINVSEESLLENINKTNALFTISDILNINSPFINSIK